MMDETERHINFLGDTAYLNLFSLQGEQDDTKRFIYCCCESQHKVILAISELYPLIDNNDDFEFSVGILLRTLLMYCIMITYQKSEASKLTNEDEVKKKIHFTSSMFIADGTKQILDNLKDNEYMPMEKKMPIAKALASKFPEVFEFDPVGWPKRKIQYNFTTKQLSRDTDHPKLKRKESIYNLYDYYSKYDHVSHWSSELSTHSPLEERKNKISASVIMVLYGFRDLIETGMRYGDSLRKLLQPA